MAPVGGEGTTRDRYVTTLPALAGVVLGLLYAIGALVRTAELREAGLNVGDTITLFPIEQHLARGIAIVLSPSAIFIALIALAFTLALPRLLDWMNPPRHAEVDRKDTRLARVIVACVAVGLAIGAPLTLAAIVVFLAGAAAVLVATGSRISRRGIVLADMRPLVLAASFLVGLGCSTILLAITEPRPLPEVSLDLRNGDTLHGGLIVVADGTWYLDARDPRFTAVPVEQVLTSRVRSRDLPEEERNFGRTLPDLLGGD